MSCNSCGSCNTCKIECEILVQCPEGSAGPQGPEGVSGPEGLEGLPGLKGASGPTGKQGETGPEGDAGDAGDTGTPGIAGNQGPKGLQGIKGLKGPVGAPGLDATLTVDINKYGSIVTTNGHILKLHNLTMAILSTIKTPECPPQVCELGNWRIRNIITDDSIEMTIPISTNPLIGMFGMQGQIEDPSRKIGWIASSPTQGVISNNVFRVNMPETNANIDIGIACDDNSMDKFFTPLLTIKSEVPMGKTHMEITGQHYEVIGSTLIDPDQFLPLNTPITVEIVGDNFVVQLPAGYADGPFVFNISSLNIGLPMRFSIVAMPAESKQFLDGMPVVGRYDKQPKITVCTT